MTDTKLEPIESTLAHHEHQIEELSDVINAQWKEIDRLKQQIARLENKLTGLAGNAQDTTPMSAIEAAARDKPPHY